MMGSRRFEAWAGESSPMLRRASSMQGPCVICKRLGGGDIDAALRTEQGTAPVETAWAPFRRSTASLTVLA